MNFGEAIEALKKGKRVTRKGWNGKNMFLWLLPASMVKAEWCKDEYLKGLAEANGGEVECLGAIRMKTADNKVLTGWLASQTDMLSEDWELYGESENSTTDGWNYRGVRFLRADVCPISFEDAEVNGENDNEDEPNIPCYESGRWNILIDIKTGKVLNWKQGVDARVYYKVVDEGVYTMYDNSMRKVDEYEGYVPDLMSLDDNGYGDYMNLTINEDGFIEDWPVNINSYIDEVFDNSYIGEVFDEC